MVVVVEWVGWEKGVNQRVTTLEERRGAGWGGAAHFTVCRRAGRAVCRHAAVPWRICCPAHHTTALQRKEPTSVLKRLAALTTCSTVLAPAQPVLLRPRLESSGGGAVVGDGGDSGGLPFAAGPGGLGTPSMSFVPCAESLSVAIPLEEEQGQVGGPSRPGLCLTVGACRAS